jgi:hypothetical protein
MAVTSVVLDIRANTDRALNEFKRFSAQLDNKFLISGLKLDVVRNALGQINREFQKAIGEQGLQAGQSLRAAQNQAALLTQTFKGFSSAASLDMATQFSTAFNEIAVKAGGTAQDIQKALAATPFISTNLSEDMRKALGQGVLSFQRDFRRAGLGEDFSGIARQFLMGQLSAEQMINSGDAAQSFLGTQLARSTGTVGLITNAQQRSEALLNIIQDPAFNKQLTDMARRAYGFRAIIEDLNTRLFNPERGIFGSLRQVTMSIRDKTTIFDETEKLINSVFGQQGLFVNFFRQIGKIFGIEDPLKVIIIGVRFITRQFNKLNEFIQDPAFQNVVKLVQGVFANIKNFFTAIYDQVQSGSFQPEPINVQIRSIGESIRGFFKQIGDAIRGRDISKETEGSASVTRTIIDELGKTIISFFREVGGALLDKAGAISLELVKVLPGTIAKLFGSLFTEGGVIGQAIGVAIATRLGIGGLRALGSARQGLGGIIGGDGGPLGAANRFLNRPFGSLFGRGGDNAVTETPETTFRTQMLALVRRIADCVCRAGSGGGGPDIDADGPDRRAAGRRRVQGLGYAGPRRAASSVPPLGAGGFPMDEALDPYTRTRRNRSGFISRISQTLLGTAEDDALLGSTSMGRGNIAARFNRRYGSGGTRAVLGRGLRGLGRGALIAGGITAGLGLFGAGSANAAEMGEGQTFGAVGMGAAEGALTGAMFGPWGAAIGGVIGAGVSLMDKRVRDSVLKSTTDFANGALKKLQELGTWLFNGIKGAFDGIKNFTSNIDWKNLVLDIIFPGRGVARTIAEASGVQSNGQNQGGFIGKVMDFAASIFGIREVGGPVIRGQSYIVGERGPEIFTPGRSGTISANRELRALGSAGSRGGSVSANFNIAINVNGNMGAENVESLRGPVLAIIQDAWNEVTYGTVTRGAIA